MPNNLVGIVKLADVRHLMKSILRKLSTYEYDANAGTYREKPHKTTEDISHEATTHSETDADEKRETKLVETVETATYRREVVLKGFVESQHIVYGVVMEPTASGTISRESNTFDGTVEDTDCHDHFTTEEEIFKAMTAFMEDLASGVTGHYDVNHVNNATAPVAIIENWQAKSDMKLNGYDIRKGSWLQGIKVYKEELWNRMLKGEITGLSIEGRAKLAKAPTTLKPS